MAAITWEDVAQLASELAGDKLSPIAQEMILNVANAHLAVDVWGGEASEHLRMGRALFAAHLATLALRKGKAGILTSESAGGLAKSYANPMLQTNSTLQTTSYGVLYMQLARTRGAARAGFAITNRSKSPIDTGWDG